MGQRTSRIIDVPIEGRPNIYTVTRPRVWRCSVCAKERTDFEAAMERCDVFNNRRNRWDWTPDQRARFAELTSRVHFAVPLPRVAAGRGQMRHITHEAIAWIAAQREEGASLSQIAAAVGVSRSEVSRICREQAQQRAQQKAPQPRHSLFP